jgi:uncharacterized protein (TIGR02246 family)
MKKATLKFLFIFLFLINIAHANVPGTEITALLDQWNAALQTQQPALVAQLYSPRALFLPISSDSVYAGRASIESYLTDFLKLKPQVKVLERYIEIFNGDTAVDAGKYQINLVKDGQNQTIMARYSITYKNIGSQWLIISHHSSVMP